MRWFQAYSHMVAALFAALLSLAGAAHAQTITNTARATWAQGGDGRSVQSNTVRISVEARLLTVDVLSPQPSGQMFPIRTPQCGGPSAEALPGGHGDVIDMRAAVTTSLTAGDLVILRVTAPRSDSDPGVIDTLQVTVTATSGDKETVTTFETGPDTGIFVGALRSASARSGNTNGNCLLSIAGGDTLTIAVLGFRGELVQAANNVTVRPDQASIAFDSEDGTPVSGVEVTLVNATSGQPALVYADDGITPWPATVTTGAAVMDSAGISYPMTPGEYRFPVVPAGSYRLVISPPSPLVAPSSAAADELARLARPDGGAFRISDASYGRSFDLPATGPVRADIPLDSPSTGVTLAKTVSRARAQPGDVILYTVTIANADRGRTQRSVRLVDTPSPWLRLQKDSLRIDGQPAGSSASVSQDGRRLTVNPGAIAPGAAVKVTYAMALRADTPPGQVANRAETLDARGNRAVAQAIVTVDPDSIAGRMTVIGRVMLAPCLNGKASVGIPGVRVMLEDGSFAITDRDGRYHFEGVAPGTHVVALAPTTLPAGARPVDCERSTRSAGSAVSRFVIGQGGSLAVADFHAEIPGWQPAPGPAAGDPDTAPALTPSNSGLPSAASDRAAAGGETDWFTLGDGPTDFLFPTVEHNPRIPSIRAVIRHRNGQKIALAINGKPVDQLAFEGTRVAPGGGWAVSIWRGIPLAGPRNVLTATVTNDDGRVDRQLERVVQFVSAPWRAELVPGQSRLVADGKTRPVAAVRFLDRAGRPVRSGVTGNFAVGEPYESAALLDQLQLGQLSAPVGGQSPGSANWTINNDEGIALIELAPTMVSGPLHLQFNFSDDDLNRVQQLEGWVVPGDLPFTLVGLAEGTLGARTVADQMDRSGRFDSDLGDNARVAFYAKGRVLGKVLLTLAYDSAKEKAGQRLLGSIDPGAYYTVYADGTTRRFDAASTEKLYVRVEAASFYALYGDFITGFDQSQLARYQRSLTGVKAETRLGAVHAQAFAAKIAGRHRRDEIQGAGLSGPYTLTDRNLLANSEKVAIEVRDRLRSEIIVSRRELVRFIDYDIDILAGTISFREPILSRDFDLNPQFIVIDYEAADGLGQAQWNAGVRGDVTLGKGDAVRLGATLISDRGDGPRTGVAAVDLRARLGAGTEIRAEAALSRREDENANAWLVEAEHRTGRMDVLAYARQLDNRFGTGQQNGVELGRRKFGVDARYALDNNASVVIRSWHDTALADASRRFAVEGDVVYRGLSGDARIGVAHFDDRLASGDTARSTVIQGAATRRLFGNRLELGVGTSLALGSSGSIDLPTRHYLRARYALAEGVRLVGNYEIARGDKLDARNFNLGFELSPWAGARITSTLGQETITEAGARSYAAFGLAQSLAISPNLTLDATIDGNRDLGGAGVGDLVNPLHPAASGGQFVPNGARFEDFTAVTLGLGWRKDDWSATVRGEWREGEFADRKGVTGGLIRQLGNGITVGAGGSWTHAEGLGTASTEVAQLAIVGAYRPAGSAFASLAKLEYRGDKVTGATRGAPGPVGQTALTVDGDARSERLIASLSTNWRPDGGEGRTAGRTEVAAFLGARFSFDQLGDQDFASRAVLAGLDARFGLGERFEVGASGTVRTALAGGETSFAFGPQIGISPADNTLLTLGYNFSGFRDADFSALRHTDSGFYVAARMKFDGNTFGLLDLKR